MPELTSANIDAVSRASLARLDLLTQALNECFETRLALSPGRQVQYASLAEMPALAGPGLILAFSLGSSAMLCVLAADLPIPGWYVDPSAAQISQLEALALEWSRNCLPEELPVENVVSLTVPVLKECIVASSPVAGAACLPLLASQEGGAPATGIWLIWPVERIPTPYDPRKDSTAGAPAEAASRRRRAAPVLSGTPVDRLRNLPVPIVVKLAEKRIEMGQFLAIGPGAIITFEKSCEDLLDLYVNNQLYCRGEAVKIGEKFGIKICEVGSTAERISAVLAIS